MNGEGETKPWYASIFGDDYIEENRDALGEARTSREVALLRERLSLRPGDRVLDVPCGHGRHAIPLAASGCLVTGVDLEPAAIRRAAASAEAAGVSERIDLRVGDMRALPFESDFDAAFSYGTSFGFFEDDAENLKTLACLAAALRPGGRLLLEQWSIFAIAQHFVERPWHETPGGHRVWIDRRLDVVGGFLEESRVVRKPDGREHAYGFRVRLYTIPELSRMIAEVGLRMIAALESPGGDDVTRTTSCFAILAEKPPRAR